MVIDSRGLRKKPTFDGTLNYLQYGQETIKYPDRKATFLRDSPDMGFLDNFVTAHLQEQERNMAKEPVTKARMRQMALEQGGKEGGKGRGRGRGGPPPTDESASEIASADDEADQELNTAADHGTRSLAGRVLSTAGWAASRAAMIGVGVPLALAWGATNLIGDDMARRREQA